LLTRDLNSDNCAPGTLLQLGTVASMMACVIRGG